ncbi:secondary thiamine-phosphate synthase enzyme YjbQ [Thioalkalivibrio sulfidiphilus]|uniref:secondary thiamine-phosphate synthase enzyme YjbQ n=1 Tax=Thioalkalivibrio sulfidiphilus TaxID=1033854 RepID=UPI0003656938|nr:secondary thiamine-phosphate synthase enzyme YjbQ [Thioalkalivibrio sulfidiphilus]
MSLMQTTHMLEIETRGPGLYMFTDPVRRWVADAGIRTGLLTLLIQHTSASLVIQENADPDVRGDLQRFFSRLVPENDPIYRHTLEGPDDMPAHVRSALTQTQLSIPVMDGRLALGTWQGLYVFEHRRAPQVRRVAVHLIGEG